MQKIIDIALDQYDVREIPGAKHNSRVVSFFNEIGFKNIQNDETPWCSAFVNWVCMKANVETSNKLNARSWLNVGDSIETPRKGDIVVLWRDKPNSWKGHVGFFIKETEKHVYILGGNQSNRVNITSYPKYRLLDYRRPRELNIN